jgi:hypothetical protein
MKVQFAHIIDKNNLGDKVCSPIDYITLPDGVSFERLDIRSPDERFNGDIVVFGGGGMLHPDVDYRMVSILVEQICAKRKTVVWGIGTNYHHTNRAVWPKWLGDCNLIGLRDKGSPYQLVPCPSCLHLAFDDAIKLQPTRESVVYEHWQHPLGWTGYPVRVSNRQRVANLQWVLGYLASGETVITNTYHGAYWASLLGRKVKIIEPFSNRFTHGFHFPVGEAVPGLLEECRNLNRQFEDKFRELL